MPDAPRSDDLIRRAQAGDVRAFEQLIDSFIPQVRRFARAFARLDADGDDLAQDALLKVYRSLGSYRFQSAFSTWLYAITRNCFLDAAKSRGAREQASAVSLTDATAALVGAAMTTAGADDLLAGEEDRQRLWTAIKEVPPDFRTVLVLYDIEGLSYDEVAAVEGLALGTVKSRLNRARAHLRGTLGRWQAGPTETAPARNPAPTGLVTPEEGI